MLNANILGVTRPGTDPGSTAQEPDALPTVLAWYDSRAFHEDNPPSISNTRTFNVA